MCWAEHRGNYNNLLTHTFDHQPYVSREVLFMIEAIIPLSKEFSIDFWKFWLKGEGID